MHPMRNGRARQRRALRRGIESSDAYVFFNLLTDEGSLEQIEALLPVHRERLFPPTEVLSMFMAQALSADRSCQKAVNDLVAKRVAGGLSACSTYTGAYCRARQRLPDVLVSTLVRHTARTMTAQRAPCSRGQGRRVRMADGTTVPLFATYFLLCELQRRGVDGVFEQYGARVAVPTSGAAGTWAHATT